MRSILFRNRHFFVLDLTALAVILAVAFFGTLTEEQVAYVCGNLVEVLPS